MKRLTVASLGVLVLLLPLRSTFGSVEVEPEINFGPCSGPANCGTAKTVKKVTDMLEDPSRVQVTMNISGQLGNIDAAKSGSASVSFGFGSDKITAKPAGEKTWGQVASCSDLVITCEPE